MPKLTKAQLLQEERERRQGISPDLIMAYCERDENWYEFDKVWSGPECPTCGGPPSYRLGYQMTTSRTWNSLLSRPKIKKKTTGNML